MKKFLLKVIARKAEKEVCGLHNPRRGNPHTAGFRIKKELKEDSGREVARMHVSNRRFASRYDIIRIKHGTNQVFVPILGLDGVENKAVARLGYDLRERLGISKTDVSTDKRINLTTEQVGWWGQLYWYLSTKDPAVKVPAWLAFWSFILGATGLTLAVLSILLGIVTTLF